MKTLFLILVLSSTYLCSQNLVPNPSFEEYDEELFYWYPENTDTFTFNAVSYPPLHWVDAFRSPNYLTPIDDSIRTFFFDFGTEGYQNYYLPARTGSHYIMLISYEFRMPTFLYVNAREYTTNQLKEPLQAGVEYCISFFVKQAPGRCTASIDQLGAIVTHEELNGYFSFYEGDEYIPPNSTENVLKTFEPQALSPVGELVENQEEWLKVSGSFIAEGGEEFISLGCFINDTLLTRNSENLCEDSGMGYSRTYGSYFFDDVSVYRCDEIHYQADAGKEECITSGDSIQLGAHDYEDYFYEWRVNGSVFSTEGMPWVSPDTTSIYGLYQQDFAFNETWSEVSVVVLENPEDECVGLGLNEQLESEISIYPNPSNGIYKLESPYLIEYIEVYNVIGELLSTSPVHAKEFELDIQQRTKGIYFVKMSIGEQSIWKKILNE